jgi:hypothetical protein
MTDEKPIDWAARKERARAFLKDKPKQKQPWTSKQYDWKDKENDNTSNLREA